MLALLSYIYWLIWTIRKWLYEIGIFRTRRLPCPVVCVGNLTVGGTGKTPTVITLTRLLQKKISPIAVLTRGYKRRSLSPTLVVSDGNKIISTPQEAGDEPYLIASALKDVPVIVGPDRYSSGRYAIDYFDTHLFILDDGYQHLRLHRDLNILLIDATNPFGNGHLLPGGILREPLSGISRADCIIISRANEGDVAYVEDLVRSYNKDSPIFYASYKATNVTAWSCRGERPFAPTGGFSGENMGSVPIADKTLLLFSGIGNPHSFRKTIEDIGGRIKGEIIFPDHHWYRDKDMKKISEEARRLSVDAILTTEKDAVRIHDNLLKKMDIDILVLQVEMEIDKGFGEWILKQVAGSRKTCYLLPKVRGQIG